MDMSIIRPRCDSLSGILCRPIFYWVRLCLVLIIMIVINILINNNVNYCKDHGCPDSSDELLYISLLLSFCVFCLNVFYVVCFGCLMAHMYHGTSANAPTAASTHSYARRLRHCSSNRSHALTSRNVLFDAPRRVWNSLPASVIGSDSLSV